VSSPVNCFYVYPTVVGGTALNAPLKVQPVIRQTAIEQASQNYRYPLKGETRQCHSHSKLSLLATAKLFKEHEAKVVDTVISFHLVRVDR